MTAGSEKRIIGRGKFQPLVERRDRGLLVAVPRFEPGQSVDTAEIGVRGGAGEVGAIDEGLQCPARDLVAAGDQRLKTLLIQVEGLVPGNLIERVDPRQRRIDPAGADFGPGGHFAEEQRVEIGRIDDVEFCDRRVPQTLVQGVDAEGDAGDLAAGRAVAQLGREIHRILETAGGEIGEHGVLAQDLRLAVEPQRLVVEASCAFQFAGLLGLFGGKIGPGQRLRDDRRNARLGRIHRIGSGEGAKGRRNDQTDHRGQAETTFQGHGTSSSRHGGRRSAIGFRRAK